MTDLKMVEISVVTETEAVAYPVFGRVSTSSAHNMIAGGVNNGYKTIVKKAVYGPFEHIDVYGTVIVAKKNGWASDAQAVIQLPQGASYVIRDASSDEELVNLVSTMSSDQLEILRNFIKTAV
jgi:hypothetical protein